MTAATTAHPGVTQTRAATFRVIAAAAIGNALEWFDILIYGYFAVTISKVFFPGTDETASLLLTFATFGVSYFIRPLGAIVLGGYADRAGRKAALFLSIMLMMIGTLLMAVMPGYATIGILAPIGVLLARLMQGFAVAGEFGSATAFLAEHGSGRRGFFASWQWSGQGLATALASAFGFVLTTTLTPDQLQSWGWRIPFLFGLLIGPIGLYIRSQVDETPEFLTTEVAKAPVREIFRDQLDRLLLAVGTVVISTSANYLILYMPTYGTQELHLPQSTGFIATLIGGIVLTVGAPLVGHWSDAVGRVRIMLAATALFFLTAYPAFLFLNSYASLSAIVLLVVWLSLLKTAYSGSLPALLADMFPTRTRGTGIALSYNIGVPIFGGLSPLIGTWLIKTTGDKLSPSFYLMLTALLSLAALVAIRRRYRLQ
jgi:MHS family proline/betaine transporter-like MFS transporter